jgi:hypothetical protein
LGYQPCVEVGGQAQCDAYFFMIHTPIA